MIAVSFLIEREQIRLQHFNLRLWPLRIGFSWPKDRKLLDPNQQARDVSDVCDRDMCFIFRIGCVWTLGVVWIVISCNGLTGS